jgi:two-component system cell cycle sensor histidine kinase/response regulator CckA
VLVHGDPNQIEQVIVNLSVNARDAMTKGGTVRIRTAHERFDDDVATQVGLSGAGEYAVLEVSDTGVGMDSEVLERAIEPFYTTKGPDKGTGLGLYMVYGLAQRSGGTLWIRSTPMEGTQVRFILPFSEQEEAEKPHEVREQTSGGTETILLVEDEPAVQRLLKRTLEHAGYRLLLASDGVEALEVAERFDGPIQLLISDIVMPRLRGGRLAQRLMQERPGIKVLFVTGYPEDETDAHLLASYLLQKPFSADDLLAKVRELLDTEGGPLSAMATRPT